MVAKKEPTPSAASAQAAPAPTASGAALNASVNSQKQAELGEWSMLVAELRPLEQLALVGLLNMDPTLQPASIEVARIVGENKCERASRWLSINIRDLLYCYCGFCDQIARPLGGTAGNTMDLIPGLAGVLVSQGLIAGVAVALAAWAIQTGLRSWCEKFGKIQMDGNGTYEIDPYENYDGSFPPVGGPQKLPGLYAVTYFPSIHHSVRDPDYPIPNHQIVIDTPARAEGVFRPVHRTSLATISDFQEPKHGQRFAFSDSRTQRQLSGSLNVSEIEITEAEVKFSTEAIEFDSAQPKASTGQ